MTALDVGSGPCPECRGIGCAVCGAFGTCPGCGRRYAYEPSPMPAAWAKEDGFILWMCPGCGRHERMKRDGESATEALNRLMGAKGGCA